MRRSPHVLLTEREVRTATDFLLGEPEFVIDLETTSLDTSTNQVTWIGLGCAGRVFIIPTAHPKGIKLSAETTTTWPAFLAFPPDDPRHWTEGTKDLTDIEQRRPSKRAIPRKVPATYAKPPSQLPAGTAFQILEPLLFSDRPKIGHNLKFDLLTSAKYFGAIPPGPYHDTVILQHVVDERLTQYELKDLSIKWYEPKDPKAWYPKLAAQGLDNFGLDEATRYVAKDLRYCWMLKQRLWKRLVSQELVTAYQFEMELYPVLMEMEQVGFPIQEDLLGHVGQTLNEEIARIEQEAWARAGGQFPLSNLRAKRWVLFGYLEPRMKKGEKIGGFHEDVIWQHPDDPAQEIVTKLGPDTPLTTEGLRPLSHTPKMKIPQLNQAVLDYYADRNPMAKLLSDWSTYDKLRGTFVEGFTSKLRRNHPGLPTLHTSLKQHGTVTGRLSSSKPNLQQIPRGTTIREMFVADEGHVLIVADYDQIELRCLAHEASEPKMLQIFQAGRDIHAEATSVAMQIPLERVTDALRQVGKTLNFATGYGAGPERIAAVAKVSTRRGKEFLDRYYREFAALNPWKNAVLAEARSRCDPGNMGAAPPYVLIPPTGRKRRLPDLLTYTKDDEYERYRAERQAINAVVQGFASNIAKMAMIDLRPKLAELPARMILQVHDEIIVRVKAPYADEVLDIVTTSMSGVRSPDGSPILGDIPLIVSAKAGYSWASAKGK